MSPRPGHKRVPDPLEWHPYYQGHTGLLDAFLLDEARWYWQVYVPPRLADYVKVWEDGPVSEKLEVIELRKERCAGAAPYVGEPFIYTWTVATDHLGRAIATDSERYYPFRE